MSSPYQIDKQDGAYFLTFTIVEWIDLFIRDNYKQLIADNLNFCIDKLGFEVFSYVIMPSHLHMIAIAKDYSGDKSPVKVSMIEIHLL